jgi:hypothetical protein
VLAKLASKNHLTVPKSATNAIGAPEYFDVEVKSGQIILTPMRILHADAVRAKLTEIAITEKNIAHAVVSARRPNRRKK